MPGEERDTLLILQIQVEERFKTVFRELAEIKQILHDGLNSRPTHEHVEHIAKSAAQEAALLVIRQNGNGRGGNGGHGSPPSSRQGGDLLVWLQQNGKLLIGLGVVIGTALAAFILALGGTNLAHWLGGNP